MGFQCYLIKEKSRFQGGLSTRNEMCLSYLLYYPRINLTRCASIPDIMEQLQFIGVKEIYRPVRYVKCLWICVSPLFLSVGFLDPFHTTFLSLWQCNMATHATFFFGQYALLLCMSPAKLVHIFFFSSDRKAVFLLRKKYCSHGVFFPHHNRL